MRIAGNKMAVVDLSASERDMWQDATSSVIDRFMSEVGPAGEAVVKAGIAEGGN